MVKKETEDLVKVQDPSAESAPIPEQPALSPVLIPADESNVVSSQQSEQDIFKAESAAAPEIPANDEEVAEDSHHETQEEKMEIENEKEEIEETEGQKEETSDELPNDEIPADKIDAAVQENKENGNEEVRFISINFDLLLPCD
jgi:hypothetical protein